MPAGALGRKANWRQKWREVDSGVKDFTKVERSESIQCVSIGGCVEPVYQESTWKENEEMMTGLDSFVVLSREN